LKQQSEHRWHSPAGGSSGDPAALPAARCRSPRADPADDRVLVGLCRGWCGDRSSTMSSSSSKGFLLGAVGTTAARGGGGTGGRGSWTIIVVVDVDGTVCACVANPTTTK